MVMQMTCGHEQSKVPTKWQQLGLGSGKYQVFCGICRKHGKWGNQAELDRLISWGKPVTVVAYVEPTVGPTLEAFFVDPD